MSNSIVGSNTLKFDVVISVILSEEDYRKIPSDLHQEVFWMHKAEVEWMKEEITLEIMGNQKESQRGKDLNQEYQKIVGTIGN